IEHRWVTKSVERAQKKVEERNFEIRKRLLEYDEVMNEQRTLIYDYRQQILRNEGLRELVERMFSEVIELVVDREIGEDSPDPEAREAANRNLQDWAKRKIGRELPSIPKERDEIVAAMMAAVKGRYDEREAEMGAEMLRKVERFILLDAFDAKWKDHL